MAYPDFQEAVKLCLSAGASCHVAKSDMSSAFRHVPLNSVAWPNLILKAQHPTTGVWYFFVDKCLPFGSVISCVIFQAFSDTVAFIVSFNTKKPLINYLDDYLFVAFIKRECDEQVKVFIQACSQIKFPVALEKTWWGTTLLSFLGLLLDTVNSVVCLPTDEVQKALNWVEFFLNKENKKATVLQYQKLCGTLNFLCRCVILGRDQNLHTFQW